MISPRQLLPEGPNGPNSGEALTGKAQRAASPCQQPSGRAQKLLPAPEEPPSPFTALPGGSYPAPSPNRPPRPLLPSRPPQPPPLTAPCRCRMRSAGAAPPPPASRGRHVTARREGRGEQGVRGWGGTERPRGHGAAGALREWRQAPGASQSNVRRTETGPTSHLGQQ